MNYQVLFSDESIFVTFIASFLIWFMFGGLSILWVIDGKFKKEEALHALFSVILSWVITEIIKSLFPVIRPFEIDGDLPLTITIPQNPSFPSSHSAVAFALAFTIWLHNRKTGGKFMILAFLVAIGRTLANVHSLIDVVVGGLVGIGVAYIIARIHLFKLLSKKNKSN